MLDGIGTTSYDLNDSGGRYGGEFKVDRWQIPRLFHHEDFGPQALWKEARDVW